MNVPHPPSFLCTLTGGHIWDFDKDAWLRVNARAIMLSEPGKPLGPGLVDVAEGPCVICRRPWSAEAKTMRPTERRMPLIAAVVSSLVTVWAVVVMVFFDRGVWLIVQGVLVVLNVAGAVFNGRLWWRRRRREIRERATEGG